MLIGACSHIFALFEFRHWMLSTDECKHRFLSVWFNIRINETIKRKKNLTRKPHLCIKNRSHSPPAMCAYFEVGELLQRLTSHYVWTRSLSQYSCLIKLLDFRKLGQMLKYGCNFQLFLCVTELFSVLVWCNRTANQMWSIMLGILYLM